MTRTTFNSHARRRYPAAVAATSTSLIAGICVALGTVTAGAAERATPNPAERLELGEAAAIALFDQSMNLLAGVVEEQGCSNASGSYPFVAEVMADGAGRAQFGELPMSVTVEHQRRLGLLLSVKSSASAPVAGTGVDAVDGRYSFSRDRQMLLASSSFSLDGGIDYRDRVIGGGVAAGVAGRDRDMEETSIVLMRYRAPTSRWQHMFTYERTDARRAEYRSVRERRQMKGNAPCVLSSHDVVTRIDETDGRVRMYGALRVNAGPSTQDDGPLSVESPAAAAKVAPLLSISWDRRDDTRRVDELATHEADNGAVRVRIWAVGD